SASSVGAFFQWRQSTTIDIVCVDLPFVLHQRRERERLSATASTNIGYLNAWLYAAQLSGQLAAFVLDLKPPLEKTLLGRPRKRPPLRPRNANAVRRKRRRRGRLFQFRT